MTIERGGIGPDLVVAGAARSGTTQLTARLGMHPSVDPCVVKEPNYFSREYDRGEDWYDSYFAPREGGLARLDASVSYTFPQFPQALDRLAAASPDAYVVYVVREPLARAVSHYHLNKFYFGHEKAADFGAAVRSGSPYLDVSDYEHWLGRLHATFADDRVLVVPFQSVASRGQEVADVVFGGLGLGPFDDVDEGELSAHRHNVVTFRGQASRRLTRTLRHSRAYPAVRRVLGAHTVKRIRSLVTAPVPDMPSVADELQSCDAQQRRDMERLRERAEESVTSHLAEQDARLGLDWSGDWPSSSR
jgi:hypothetical protein